MFVEPSSQKMEVFHLNGSTVVGYSDCYFVFFDDNLVIIPMKQLDAVEIRFEHLFIVKGHSPQKPQFLGFCR